MSEYAFILERINDCGSRPNESLSDAIERLSVCADELRNTLSAEQRILLTDCENAYSVTDGETMNCYDTFICKLCELARTQKRVTATEKPTDNEKYAFRCFLLRLGFIGAEYKAARKILLKSLSGSSAFKNGGTDRAVSE